MQFLDFSPPSSPTVEQQGDDLKKGLGRCVGWAERGALADGPLLDACLHDKRFDWQTEGRRSDWLWSLIALTGAETRCEQPILEALQRTTTDDLDQLCGLAAHYAKRGSAEFTRRLYEIVEEKPVAFRPYVGEEDLIDVAGEEALLFIARVRGRRLEHEPWDWDQAEVVRIAIEKLGEERLRALLSDSSEPSVRRFAAAWQESLAAPPAPQASIRRAPDSEIEQILSSARTMDALGGPFRGFGMRATEADLQRILEVLWAATEPKEIANLLKVFSHRPLPEFDPRLIAFCDHGDERVRRWAFNAVTRNSHPLVRDFAIEQLHRPTLEFPAIALFVRNYRPGDERQLLTVAELPQDEWWLHYCLMDVLNFLENNPEADSSQLGLIAYFHTPCAMCRSRAIERLVEERVAPDWLLAECQNDCDEDCRELAADG